MVKLSLCNYIAGAGKDSIADYLVENHGFKKYALADGIYDIAREHFGMIAKDRDLIIQIGEKLREIDPMVWITYTLKRIAEDGHDKVVITDTRKILEYGYLMESGFENVMVYCKPEVALERLKNRDGDAKEDTVMNSSLENQLRPLVNVMTTIDNTYDWEDTKKEIDCIIAKLVGNVEE